MSSGRKQLRQNTRERVISTDFNRAQAFGYGYSNEFLREQVLAPTDADYYAGVTFDVTGPAIGGPIPPTFAINQIAPTAPDYGTVLNGLMVVVPVGGTSLLVSGGSLLVIDPEGLPGSSDPSPLNPDDGPGPNRTVYSAGINALGVLNWTPYAGAGNRIDVVECQRTNIVTETDNRDIFNPATGLFTPQAVTKVTAGDLTFRIRLGVAANTIPAPALGWFPLAVISTPAGALNLDTCYIWDVRDLASDMAEPNVRRTAVVGRPETQNLYADPFTAPAELRLSGESTATWGHYRFGGKLYDPRTALNYRDLLDANFSQEPGFGPIANQPYYIYAVFPDPYRRWVGYTNTAITGYAGRIPGGFRGILTVSILAPIIVTNTPFLPIAPPPGWGINSLTATAQFIGAGKVDAALNLEQFVSSDRVTSAWQAPGITTPGALTAIPNTYSFPLLAGPNFPTNSRSIRVLFAVNITGMAANAALRINSYSGLFDSVNVQVQSLDNLWSDQVVCDLAGAVQYFRTVEILNPFYGIEDAPLCLPYLFITATPIGGAGAPVIATAASVIGWSV
jgi:hypothetical protein